MRENVLINYLDNMRYSDEQASKVQSDLSEISPELKPVLQSWYSTGQFANYECQGYSIFRLMQMYGLNYVAALLTIDWLIKEPAEAKRLIAQCVV